MCNIKFKMVDTSVLYGRKIKSNAELHMIREKSVLIQFP